MFTEFTLRCQVVWDDVLWRVVAVWTDDQGSEPVVLEKSGRAPLDGAEGPDDVMAAAIRAMAGRPLAEGVRAENP